MRTIVLAGNLRSNEKQPSPSDNLCGQVDMFDLCGALHDVGYSYMLMPDHAPNHPDDPGVGTPNASVLLADEAVEFN